MSTPLDKGRLGINRFDDIITALIVKWIFHFANDRNNLWRKVVTAKCGLDSWCLIPSLSTFKKKSTLFNLVRTALDRNSKAFDLVRRGFRVIVGNSLNVNFWSDDWTTLESLKLSFPSIYALAISKEGLVAN